eukprot:4097534-Amphidinium_carterae.1
MTKRACCTRAPMPPRPDVTAVARTSDLPIQQTSLIQLPTHTSQIIEDECAKCASPLMRCLMARVDGFARNSHQAASACDDAETHSVSDTSAARTICVMSTRQKVLQASAPMSFFWACSPCAGRAVPRVVSRTSDTLSRESRCPDVPS